MVEFLASERHYLDHLIPTFLALPEEYRGVFHVNQPLYSYAVSKGVPPSEIKQFSYEKTLEGAEVRVPNFHIEENIVVTAAFKDAEWVKSLSPGKRIILCEHGHGQTYNVGNSSYAGGIGRGFISLFLVPGEVPYQKQLNVYPHIPVVKTGCPKLDWIHNFVKDNKVLQLHEMTIGISFHWFGEAVCPEAGSSWAYFWKNVVSLIKNNPQTRFIGHGHPRSFKDEVMERWVALTKECPNLSLCDDFNLILAVADLYLIDQSSTAYEFMALNKPVIFMDSPHFRKDVEHGLRFWALSDCATHCNQHESLQDKVKEAIRAEIEGKYEQKRKDYTKLVYSVPLGQAAKATTGAIIDFLEGKLGVTNMSEDKVVKMRALKLLVQDEGTILPGVVFQPGYLHSLAKENGVTVAIPIKRIEYISIKGHAHRMSSHGDAEYVVEVSEPVLEQPVPELETPCPVIQAEEPALEVKEDGEIHSDSGRLECDVSDGEASPESGQHPGGCPDHIYDPSSSE